MSGRQVKRRRRGARGQAERASWRWRGPIIVVDTLDKEIREKWEALVEEHKAKAAEAS